MRNLIWQIYKHHIFTWKFSLTEKVTMCMLKLNNRRPKDICEHYSDARDMTVVFQQWMKTNSSFNKTMSLLKERSRPWYRQYLFMEWAQAVWNLFSLHSVSIISHYSLNYVSVGANCIQQSAYISLVLSNWSWALPPDIHITPCQSIHPSCFSASQFWC